MKRLCGSFRVLLLWCKAYPPIGHGLCIGHCLVSHTAHIPFPLPVQGMYVPTGYTHSCNRTPLSLPHMSSSTRD